MSLDSALSALARVDWGGIGVRHAVLFGSLAERGRGRDVDLAVVAERFDADLVGYIAWSVADALGIPEDLVDVVDLLAAPCPVARSAARGRVVYTRSWQELAELLARRLMLCWDYEVW